MAEYTLYFTQTLSTSVTVEADDVEAAIELAYSSDQLPPGLCAYCTGMGREWHQDTSDEWLLDEESYEVDGVTHKFAGGAS